MFEIPFGEGGIAATNILFVYLWRRVTCIISTPITPYGGGSRIAATGLLGIKKAMIQQSFLIS